MSHNNCAISYFVTLEVIVCKEMSAFETPRGALRYLRSMFASSSRSLSLASWTGFVASLPNSSFDPSAGKGKQAGRNVRPSMSAVIDGFHPLKI